MTAFRTPLAGLGKHLLPRAQGLIRRIYGEVHEEAQGEFVREVEPRIPVRKGRLRRGLRVSRNRPRYTGPAHRSTVAPTKAGAPSYVSLSAENRGFDYAPPVERKRRMFARAFRHLLQFGDQLLERAIKRASRGV